MNKSSKMVSDYYA